MNKPPYYNTFSNYLKSTFGEKVWKVSVDAGFSCPNKSGHAGTEGCIFCRLDSFCHMDSERHISVKNQIVNGIETARERKGLNKFLVYFQSSTNTFAPLPVLEKLFFDAINHEGVVGLSISTRPDCLPTNVLKLIERLSHETKVWVELGLQTIHDETLTVINRGHTFAQYQQAVKNLLELDVRICTHIMIGLPGETRDHILQTAHEMASNKTHEVKIHPLLIIKETELEKHFLDKKVNALELEDYISLACDFLERIPEGMVIQRLTAEAPEDILIEPQWSLNKLIVIQGIDKEFKKRGTRQGSKLKK